MHSKLAFAFGYIEGVAEVFHTTHIRDARLPGERAKIAVETFDERIDPVGACVGCLLYTSPMTQ